MTQSAQNANVGVGALQVADVALTQVTLLLNHATTLAREASNDSVSDAQRPATQAEYSQINSEMTAGAADITRTGSLRRVRPAETDRCCAGAYERTSGLGQRVPPNGLAPRSFGGIWEPRFPPASKNHFPLN